MSTERPQSNIAGLFVAAGVGAAVMYFLDPARGRRRRHAVADKLVHGKRLLKETSVTTARDVANRSRGLAAMTRQRFADDSADDRVLAERVRSAVGRVVSHPGAIDVAVTDAHVTLSGDVLSDEADRLLAYVRSVRGVDRVDDQLDRHESADGVSSLQGGQRPKMPQFEFLQNTWTPAARLVAGVAGGALVAAAPRRQSLSAALVRAAGAALAARAITNLSFGRLVGLGPDRHTITIRKTIHIDAPIDEVFVWLSAWERWPQWTSHVRQVHRIKAPRGNSEHTHWIVDGPAGATIEWDAITTRLEPPSAIGWRTCPGSVVEHSGVIRLVSTDIGWTRVDVRVTYSPLAGGLGHAIAKLLNRDPKTQLEHDLGRLKTTIETGRPPRDAAASDAAALDLSSLAIGRNA